MKRIYFFITSLPLMSFLFLAIAIAMAIATFLESSYGTPAAQSVIYHSWWFELLWFLFAVNLLNNIFRYRLYMKQKLTMGLFHVSFVIILIGAAITRYISYEGVMHIRENSSSNQLISSDDYFYASFNGQFFQEKVLFSELTPKRFSAKFETEKSMFKVKSVGFIENAERRIIPDEIGNAVIDFVFALPGGEGMQSVYLTKGDLIDFGGFKVSFENNQKSEVDFYEEKGQLFMVADSEVSESVMSSQEALVYETGDTIQVKNMFLYGLDESNFLIRDFYPAASFTGVKNPSVNTGEDAIIVNISDGINEKNVTVFGRSGMVGDTVEVPLTQGVLKLSYGAVLKTLPFELYLKDFQLERYPGSESPSSYASEVELRDHNSRKKEDIRIFMNNTLNYKGFKFFQSSYDQDEKGTVLSVNHDFLGTNITYLGYFLMIVGFILTLINRNSYFNLVATRLKRSNTLKIIFLTFLLSGSFIANAQTSPEATVLPDIDDPISEEFGKIWVQGRDGRTEPVSTLTGELLRKISRKSKLYGMSPDEVMLSMMTWPDVWQSLPIVKVSNEEIATQLGTASDYVSISQIFDGQGNYIIAENVRAAYQKIPALRNKLEKEYINVDERVNIFYMIVGGDFLNIFPSSGNEIPWHIPGENVHNFEEGDSLFVKNGVSFLIQSIREQNTEQSIQIVNAINSFQSKFGRELLPSETKRNIEIAYNKLNVFKRLFSFYLISGTLLLLVLFINVFRQKQVSRFIRYFFFSLIVIGFIMHTAGLIARWYISGHAPWSNGYESLVYVAWAAMLAGLIFGRKYPMVVGTSAFLSGIALFTAHLSWMNPEVTNLVPILKSYWLAIHVAIITASYGFIGLSAFLGILVIIMIILRNQSNSKKVNSIIEQITSINELSAMVGLYALTTGTFLGGVWANESWGRYWGWDPKETWALITVMIYSFIAHMRLIPSLRGIYNFNMATVIGLASVLMTYFGVNYFLSGLHSYGKGVADGIHWSVILSFLVLTALLIFAWYKDKEFEKSTQNFKSD